LDFKTEKEIRELIEEVTGIEFRCCPNCGFLQLWNESTTVKVEHMGNLEGEGTPREDSRWRCMNCLCLFDENMVEILPSGMHKGTQG